MLEHLLYQVDKRKEVKQLKTVAYIIFCWAAYVFKAFGAL